MIKFNIFTFIAALIVVVVISAIINTHNFAYEKGYAEGADSLSDKHVDQVCIQWLLRTDLEKAKKRVCNKGG